MQQKKDIILSHVSRSRLYNLDELFLGILFDRYQQQIRLSLDSVTHAPALTVTLKRQYGN